MILTAGRGLSKTTWEVCSWGRQTDRPGEGESWKQQAYNLQPADCYLMPNLTSRYCGLFTMALGLLLHTCCFVAGSASLTFALFFRHKQFTVWMHIFVWKINAEKPPQPNLEQRATLRPRQEWGQGGPGEDEEGWRWWWWKGGIVWESQQ